MLHMKLPITSQILTIILIFFISFNGCKRDTSVNSEDEAAYMADYEAPSDRWGFIDTSGNLVIKAIYDDVGPFTEGLAAVQKDGKWGYIDHSGEMVIDPVYKSAWAFHEGFARVQPFDHPDQFIDRTGKAIVADNWSAADDFSNGMARVMVGNSYGYIDASGKLIIQPIYTRGWNFQNESCIVEYHDKLGVINRDGENILEPVYDKIKRAGDGNTFLCTNANASIALDKSGKELTRLEGVKMIDSDGEVLSVREGINMYLIRLNDPEQKSKSYMNIIYLENNLWAGKIDSGYILMDKDGNALSSQTYTQINKFSDGFAAYSKANLWGYINANGEELTGEVFGLAWDYREGFARAAFQDGIAFIDKYQKLAFYPPQGTLDMRDFTEGLASVLID